MRSSVSPGTTVAGFRVLSAVGEGAMSVVLVAERVGTGERVALKLLDPELARDERFRARFLRESHIAADIDHPNAVRVFDSGEADGFLYLAMEYVDGTDLRELLRRAGRLEPERAVELAGQVASALDAAHAAGLIHRDVKPANILVARDGDERAVVCDFGLARHVSSAASLTSDRAFVGTIDYVPPEQIEGGTIDGRADVYSLGCVLYECLTGERPYERESELSVLFAHLNEPPPAISAVRPELAAFDGVLATALAKSPDDRFDTCGELVEAARAALRGEAYTRRRSRRRLVLLAAALAAAAIAVVAGVLATRGGSQHAVTPPVGLRGNQLNLVDVSNKAVRASVPVGEQLSGANAPVDVAVTGRSAWILLPASQRLRRVNLTTHRIERTVRLPWYPAARIATGGGFVWTSQDGGPGVLGIDLRSGRIARQFEVSGGNGVGIAYGAGSVWLAQGTDVARIDPRGGRVVVRIHQQPGQVGETEWLLFADGYLWGAGPDGQVRKYDPGANQIVSHNHVHGFIEDLALGSSLWVSSALEGVVYQLDRDDLGVAGTVTVGGSPERVSLGRGRVWVSNAVDDSVASISEATGDFQRLGTSARPETALFARGLLVTVASPAPVALSPIKGEEIRISIPQSPLHFDPARPQTALDRALRYAICANLLAYGDSDETAGGTLRPEVAGAMPTVSPDSRTYTFHVRPGFRFSPPSSEPVTAATFKFTIERAISGGYARDDISSISGEDAFLAGRAKHISGIVARGATLRITLDRADGSLLAALSEPDLCPVPIGLPSRPIAVTKPAPSDGPYYIASSTGDSTILLRNPNYGGHRPRTPARIVFSYGLPTPQALALANQGTLDYLPPNFGATDLVDLGGPLDRQYGPGSAAARKGDARYLHTPDPGVDELVLNTTRPLFKSVRMRQAVAYGLDRQALARAFNDVPNDRIVPPAIYGFGAPHLYPLDGPNLAKARRLVGGGSHQAVLSFCANGVFGGLNQRAVAVLIRAQLARIGIDVSVTSPPCGPNQSYDANARRADLIMVSTYATLHDPDPYVGLVFATGKNGSALGTGAALRAGYERARARRGAARRAAFLQLENAILRAAPVVAYGSFYNGDYFAQQVGCKIVPPGVGVIDLAVLCKR